MPTFRAQCRSLVVPADLKRVADVRRFVDELAQEAGFDLARRFDIKLVTAEATANAMEHAETAGEVRIELVLYADRLEVRVLGLGEFRLPGSESERQHRGLGLPLMATLSDHLALYSQPDGGTLVALTFFLPGREPRAQPTLPLPPGLIEVLTESDLLDQVLDSVPQAFVVYDEQWRHVYLNQAAEELAGRPTEEVLGHLLWEVFPQVSGVWPGSEYAQAAESGRMREWTEFLPDLDRWVQRRAIPFSGGVAVIAEDVTEAKRVQQVAERSSARFELLTATASDLLACDRPQEVVGSLCRRVLDYLDCQAFFNYLAVPAQDRLRLNAYAGMPEVPAEGIEWLDYGQGVSGGVAQDRQPLVAQRILESNDPSTRLVRSFGIRAYACRPLTAAGTLLGTLSFGTTTRDEFREDELDLMKAVADQIAVALEREQSKVEQAEREERFRVTFDQAAVGMAHVGLDGRFLRVNERFAAIVGYSADELARLNFADITHPADRREDLAYANRLRRGECPDSMEKRYVRKDGSAVWVSLAGSLVGDGKSKDSYFVAVVEDIGARKQAEMERDRLLATVHATSKKLAAANRELRRQNASLSARQEELRLQTKIAEEARAAAEERSRLARALNDLNQAFTSSLSLEEVMSHVVRAAADALPAEAAVIESPGPDGWSVAYAHGLMEDPTGSSLASDGFPIATWVAGQTEPLIVEDARKERRLRSSPLVRAGVRSFIAVPLRVRDHVFGVLILLDRVPRDEFRAAQVDFVRKLGSSVSLALENSRLLGWLQEELAGNARLYHEQRAIADALQDAVLSVPARVPGIQVAHVYRSATQAARVGGDFYDVFSPREGKAAFLIGDVCGFGVRAATQAALVRDTLRAYLFGGFSLERVMSLANEVLGRQTGFAGFTTVFLGLLDVHTGEVGFCTAGHPPAVLRRTDGSIVSLSTGSLPLGAFSDSVYRIGTEVLAPGDLLLLYTDGLLEARRDGELFGERRVDEVMRGSGDGVRQLTRDLLRRVTEFSGGDLRDDLALLALSRRTRRTAAVPSAGPSR